MITNDYGMADRQKELLQFMKEVDQIMEQNGIQYSLCGGTLLGAIRHNGFIPWDDDLDIMFDRQNYSKMLELFKKNDGVVSSPSTSSNYTINRLLWVYRIQKQGDQREGLSAATVDVMVMDNCPDNLFARKIKVLTIKVLQGMMHKKLDFKKQNILMKVCLIGTYIIGRLFTDNFKFRMYDFISQIGNGRRTQYVTGYNDLFKTLNCRYEGKLMEHIEKHSFEDAMFPITSEYDNYLTTQYGEYMIPPEEKDRVPIHVF